MFDGECEAEEIIYDLMIFCEKNDCKFETLVRNDIAKVFQVTGFANSIASVIFDTVVKEEDTHDEYFDRYRIIGKATGRLTKASFNFKETIANFEWDDADYDHYEIERNN